MRRTEAAGTVPPLLGGTARGMALAKAMHARPTALRIDERSLAAFLSLYESLHVAASFASGLATRREASALLGTVAAAASNGDLKAVVGLAEAGFAFPPRDRLLSQGFRILHAAGGRGLLQVLTSAALRGVPGLDATPGIADLPLGRFRGAFVVVDQAGKATHAFGTRREPFGADVDENAGWTFPTRIDRIRVFAAREGDATFLRECVAATRLYPNAVATSFGAVLDAGGTWHDLDALPDDLAVTGDLDFGDRPIPSRLFAQGTVMLAGKGDMTVPGAISVDRLSAQGYARLAVEPGCRIGELDLAEIARPVLPASMTGVHALSLSGCGPCEVPAAFHGDMEIRGTSVSGLSFVGGDLDVDVAGIRLPWGLRVAGDVEITGAAALGKGTAISGNLSVGMAGEDFAIGTGSVVEGSVDVRCGSVRIDDGVRVQGTSYLCARQVRIGDGVTFGDDVEIDCEALASGDSVVCLGTFSAPPRTVAAACRVTASAGVLSTGEAEAGTAALAAATTGGVPARDRMH